MAQTVVALGPQTLPIGATNFGPFALPVGVAAVKLSVDASSFTDPNTHLLLVAEISYDGGAHWQHLAGYNTVGGVKFFDDGSVDPNVWFEVSPITQPANANRRVRGRITLVGGSFTTTGGTITLS